MLDPSTGPDRCRTTPRHSIRTLIRLPGPSARNRRSDPVGRLPAIRRGVVLFLTLAAGQIPGIFPLHAGVLPKSDRVEAGLVGEVKTVVTMESLVKETDSYDVSGRLLRRVQEPVTGQGGLGRIEFTSEYDSAGLRRSDTVRDQTGAPIKETVYVHDHRLHRLAEVTAWADGAFVNASFYEYDDKDCLIRGLHFNAPNLVNRNFYRYDGQGRVVEESFSRNYAYERDSGQLLQWRQPTAGHEVASRYNAQGFVAEKIVHDLRGVRESRSEFDYDWRGQQIEERVYDRKNQMIGRKRYEYIYDLQGNWITETLHWWTFTPAQPCLKQSQTRQRIITYFE